MSGFGLLREKGSYFLLSFRDGKLHDLDGGHSSPEGVAKAKRLLQEIGLHDEMFEYSMAFILPVPDAEPIIDEEAAATCRTMLDFYRRGR